MMLESGGVIDVIQFAHKSDAAAVQISLGVGEWVFGLPSDGLEWRKDARHALEADQPIASIRRRPEDGVVAAEFGEGLCDVTVCNARDIGTDDDGTAERQVLEYAVHALTEITIALGCCTDALRPRARSIGRDSNPCGPARVAREASGQHLKAYALEAQRVNGTNARRKPPLAATCDWVTCEDYEVLPGSHRW